jgi:acetyl esterase/lipase
MKKYFSIVMLSVMVSPCFGEVTSREIIYKTAGTNELQMFMFAPEEHQSSDKKPALVLFAGGGWLRTKPAKFFNKATYWASRGIIMFVADYRTVNRHGTTPAECLKDAKSAVRWVRSNAEELGIDPEQILIGGGSAGGHLALGCAFIDGFNEEGEDTSVSCKPKALVLFYPTTDTTQPERRTEKVEGYAREFSPIHNLKKPIPPMLIMQGRDDKLVPLWEIELFKAEVEKLGGECTLVIYEGEGHSFSNRRKHEETMQDVDQFLVKQGYIPTVGKERQQREKTRP